MFFLSFSTRLDLFSGILWSVCVSISQRILSVLFSRTNSTLCSYNLCYARWMCRFRPVGLNTDLQVTNTTVEMDCASGCHVTKNSRCINHSNRSPVCWVAVWADFNQQNPVDGTNFGRPWCQQHGSGRACLVTGHTLSLRSPSPRL